MRKILLLLALLFIPLPLFAQFTNVTATLTDTDGQTWNNGNYLAILVNPNPQTPASINGVPLTQSQMSISGTMNGSGVLTNSFASNAIIIPSNTYWVFTICPNASVQCVVANATISGTSQDLSSTLSSSLGKIRFPASSTSYGYADSEVYPIPKPGGVYYNVTTPIQRIWTGFSWVDNGGSSTSSVEVNGSVVNNPNFNDTNPSSSNSTQNVSFAVASSDVSGSVPYQLHTIPVEAFGAVGNYGGPGIGHDDTTNIQACLNFLLATNDYNACLLAAGKYYRTTSPLVIPRGNVGLVGANNQFGIAIDSATSDGIDMGGSYSFVFLNNFFIGRSVKPDSGTMPKGISLTNCGFCRVIGVLSYDSGYSVYVQGGANNLLADGIYSASIGGYTFTTYGLYLTGPQNSIVLRNLILSDPNFNGFFHGLTITGTAFNDIDANLINVAGGNVDMEVINTGGCPNSGLYDLNLIHATLDRPVGVNGKALVVSNLCTGTNSSNSVGLTMSSSWINGSIDIESSTGVRIDGQILGAASTVTLNNSTGNKIDANFYSDTNMVLSNSNGNTIAGEWNGTNTSTPISLTSSSNNQIVPVEMVNLSTTTGVSLDSTSNNNYVSLMTGGSVTTPVSNSGTGNCINLNASGCGSTGGTGNFVNITSSLTPTGCSISGSVCTTTGTVSTITLAGIPAGYKALHIVAQGTSPSANSITCQINGDTGTNYAFNGVQSNAAPSTITGNSATSANCGLFASFVGEFTLDIPFYASTTNKKSWHEIGTAFDSVSSNTANFHHDFSGAWDSTAAITSITFNSGASINSGSSFVVYGEN